jgi:hypothetical protein
MYMLPCSCLLVLITLQYARSRVGDVCISWSNPVVVWGSDKNLCTAKVFTFLWLPH